MTPLSQRDPRWKDIKLGTGSTTIGQEGCLVTCLAMLAGTTPDVVNEELKRVGGYQNGNLVIWSALDKTNLGLRLLSVQGCITTRRYQTTSHVLLRLMAQELEQNNTLCYTSAIKG